MAQALLQPNEVFYCILVHFFVHPPAESSSSGHVFNVKRVKKDIAAFLLRELLSQDSLLYPSLPVLYSRMGQQLGEVGEELSRRVQVVLQGLATPNDLSSLFDELEALITSGTGPRAAEGVHPGSQLGLLLRRCRIMFRSMPFEAVTQLNLQLSLELSLELDLQLDREGKRGLGAASGGAGAGGLSGAPRGGREPLARLKPRHAVEAILSQHIEQMECKASGPCPAPSAVGSVPPEGRGVEEELAELDLDLPQAILVQVVAAVRALDYTAAIEALHRHYDYSSVQQREPGPGSSSGEAAGAGAAGRGQYQSALLGLADLHSLFGHTQESLQSLSEAMCLAQQAGDQVCLLHCLAALHQLMMEAPGAPGLPALGLGLGTHRRLNHHKAAADLLKRCLTQGQALHLPQLVAFGRLGLVRSAMQHSTEASRGSMLGAGGAGAGAGQGSRQQECVQIQSAAAVRDLALLHHASALDSIRGASSGPPHSAAASSASSLTEIYTEPSVHVGPGAAAAHTVSSTVMRATGSAQLLRSHACASAGCPSLAHLHALTFLACYSGHCRREDTDLARALLLRILRDKQGLGAAAGVDDEEGRGPGLGPLLGPGAREAEAEAKPLAVARLSVALEAALVEGNARQAQLLLHGMADLVSPAPHLDNDVRAQVLRHHSMVSIATGRLPDAHAAAMDLFCLSSHIGMQEEALQSLLLMAQVHVAAENWATGLMHTLSCILHASMLHYDSIGAEALTTLTHIWLHLAPSSGFELKLILQELLPFIMSAGSQVLRDKMFDLTAMIELR